MLERLSEVLWVFDACAIALVAVLLVDARRTRRQLGWPTRNTDACIAVVLVALVLTLLLLAAAWSQ
jgi:hypothetical protein